MNQPVGGKAAISRFKAIKLSEHEAEIPKLCFKTQIDHHQQLVWREDGGSNRVAGRNIQYNQTIFFEVSKRYMAVIRLNIPRCNKLKKPSPSPFQPPHPHFRLTKFPTFCFRSFETALIQFSWLTRSACPPLFAYCRVQRHFRCTGHLLRLPAIPDREEAVCQTGPMNATGYSALATTLAACLADTQHRNNNHVCTFLFLGLVSTAL